jgi:hypothetical protein
VVVSRIFRQINPLEAMAMADNERSFKETFVGKVLDDKDST